MNYDNLRMFNNEWPVISDGGLILKMSKIVGLISAKIPTAVFS
ncbi:MAG TPA: hypothetical protein P5052_00105 [Candidatus Paceibacterota bacterium]|jgi:hypothetical protein|nr:hypothetical protein [Candidatus Paceibacterota bacterium]HRZ29225.1 hypothetical protein [Candidatus Paceibacterota bacterium]